MTMTPVRPGMPLTERELQVLHGMADGHDNRTIGVTLHVSEDTVKTHACRLFRKLEVTGRGHAVAVGYRTGLLTDVPTPKPPPDMPRTDVRVWRLIEALRRWDGKYAGAVLPESARMLRHLIAEALKET